MCTYPIPGNYQPTMAEQEFLNQFYPLRYLQLPTIYNMNMAVYSSKKYLWEKLKSSISPFENHFSPVEKILGDMKVFINYTMKFIKSFYNMQMYL